MAKSYNQLWPEVVSWDNLLLAYHRCRKRKRYKPAAVQFHYAWEANLLQLQRELVASGYAPGDYYHFHISDPKPRKISAAPFRDRVVHHAIVNVLEPLYERRFICDSYACRRGKGTHRALDRAQQYLRRYPYYLKTDIVKFFPNVDHQILMGLLARTIADQRLLDLIGIIVQSGEGVLREEATHDFFPGDDLFASLRPKGLPIGNLTSQFFANVLLDPVDHFLKETLRVPGYVRYADDLVVFEESKERLWDVRERLEDRVAEIRLRLHAHKTQVGRSAGGVKFLGFVLWPSGRRIQQGGLRRFNRTLRRLKWEYAEGRIDAQRVAHSLQAWQAHTSRANTRGVRRQLWKRVRFTRRRASPKAEDPNHD